jgi:hypothetical protein
MAFRFVFAVYFLTYTHLAVAQSSTVAATSSAASPSSSSSSNGFEWGAVGDSWTSGVAYSSATVYSKTDFEYCYRTNQAWSALMEADTTWVRMTRAFDTPNRANSAIIRPQGLRTFTSLAAEVP